jgi:hypothetical protein
MFDPVQLLAQALVGRAMHDSSTSAWSAAAIMRLAPSRARPKR